MNVRKLVLFDLDGTLLLTYGAGIRAMARAGQRLFGPHFNLEQINFAGSLDSHIYLEAAANHSIPDPMSHLERFVDAYEAELAVELAAGDSKLMPGILPLLHKMREHPHMTLGLLTGNYERTGPLKLRAVGIEPGWFQIACYCDGAEDRPAMVRVGMEKWRTLRGLATEPADVVVVGDTPRDIHCAKTNGCIAFAVATGNYSVQDLKTAGADVAVEDLSDPAPLWELMES